MQRYVPAQGWRLTFFQGVVFAVFLIFSLRMYQMQIVDSADAILAAEDNRLSELPLAADRGVIFDRYDNILANNVPAYLVQVVPAELPSSREDELEIFNRLSALTEVPPTRAMADANALNVRSIEELVAEGAGIAPFRPVTIAQDVPLENALQIMEESYELPGVSVVEAAVRRYPSGEVTSHVVGYMGRIPQEQELELIEQGYDPNFDRIGYAGIEWYMENVLAGERGVELREVDVAGEVQNVISRTEPIAGQNLRLTIDVELQAEAQQALVDQIALINANAREIVTDAGVVIAMNPMTGEILSLVSYPTYDNARFARNIDVEYYLQLLENPRSPFLNQAISSEYAPGSTWKLVTAAAALEEDIIHPQSTLYDAGDLLLPNLYAPNDRAADQRFVCWNREGHGSMNMVQGLAQSCNVYFYQIGGGNPEVSQALLRPGGLGPENMFRYASALGVGTKTGIELLGEAAGRMPDRTWKRITLGENWSTGDTYNAAVGQGYVEVTPIQLANAIAAMINGGTVHQPTLVREYLDAERNVTRPFTPQVLRTANLDRPNPDGSLTLTMVEDMIIQGENSLVCRCEPFNNEFYDPELCDRENYRATVDVAEGIEEDLREYTVHVPFNYRFNDGLCDPIRFDQNYTPAFMSTETLQLVREGMRAAVEVGTAEGANLPYVQVAGKTGTAEYCDDIAGPLGLCEPGNWPSHAWFGGYAPYNDPLRPPEVLVVAFVYNGDEGSSNAVPIVTRVLEAYERLRNEREGLPQPESLASTR